MIKRVALVLTALALTVGLSAPVLAAEAGNGVIQGQLINGTAGGKSVAGQTVTLATYQSDNTTPAGIDTAKTDAEGKFAFNGLSTTSGYIYELKVIYQEADYTSPRVSFTANETTKTMTMKVYGSTDSDAAVASSSAHTIVSPGDGILQVIEVFSFRNSSDRSYIGKGDITKTGTRRTLKLPLPDGATDLQFGGDLMSDSVFQDASGFWDTMAVIPGEKQIIYSYRVPYKSGAYVFSRKIDYPVASYSFLARGEDTRVSSRLLAPTGPLDIQGAKFSGLTGDNLAPGQTLDIRLSGLPGSGSSQNVIWVIATLIALGAAGTFIYLARRKRFQTAAVSAESQPGQLRQRLLLEIAGLDDDFEDGKIEKEAYSRQRAEKKSQLLSLMQSSQEERRSV